MPFESDQPGTPAADTGQPLAAPLGGTRAEAVQRLQIGVVGLAAMLLMVALANVVMERAKESDATAVAASVDAPQEQPAEATTDPLVDAGVVPDLPAENADDVPERPAGSAGDAGR